MKVHLLFLFFYCMFHINFIIAVDTALLLLDVVASTVRVDSVVADVSHYIVCVCMCELVLHASLLLLLAECCFKPFIGFFFPYNLSSLVLTLLLYTILLLCCH